MVALALGVTALVSGLVPFYGMGLALPLVEASGSVVVSLDGRERRLELTDCTIGHDLGGYLRGSGPAGRVLLRTSGTGVGILLVIERSGQTPLVLVGEQRGVSSSQRSGVIDRRRMQLSGELREALDDTPVAVHLEATCR